MFANASMTRAMFRRPRGGWLFVCFSVALGLPLVAGCQAPLSHSQAEAEMPYETNAELIEYISELPLVTAEPAYRVTYILWKGDVYQGGFDELRGELSAGGIASDRWDLQSNSIVNRAIVAHLIARSAQIKSGVNWALTGLGRYAHRELIFRRIAHESGEMSYLSGGEFLGMLARAEEYLDELGRAASNRAELGPEQ